MTNPQYTHMTMVVDRSGSMAGLAKDCSGGINQMIADQAKLDDKMTVTLYDFDTEYSKVFGPIDVQNAPEYTLQARGGTALNDAVYRAITETGEYLAKMSEEERPGRVVFVIATDGEENSSREVSFNQVKETIEHQKDKYNWEFMFLASNMDAQAVAKTYGMSKGISTAHTADAYAASYNTMSTSLLAARSAGTSWKEQLDTGDDTTQTSTNESTSS
jgi:uncharacterized protein with von Willebrand factor type A (vWA) domain